MWSKQSEFCSRTVLNQDQTGGFCSLTINEFVSMPLSRPDICEVRKIIRRRILNIKVRVGDTQIEGADFAEVICIGALKGDTWISGDTVGFRPFGSCFKKKITVRYFEDSFD